MAQWPKENNGMTWMLDLVPGELRKVETKIPHQDQPFMVLVLLLERSQPVVTREELQGQIWTDGSFRDFDHVVNTAVAKLQIADDPRYIEDDHTS
jgi:DNA-binding winged helix-turn-helix (wHTH) protein